MKKKFQDWLRKQVGCPACDARAQSNTGTTTTTGANHWVSYSHDARLPRRTF